MKWPETFGGAMAWFFACVLAGGVIGLFGLIVLLELLYRTPWLRTSLALE